MSTPSPPACPACWSGSRPRARRALPAGDEDRRVPGAPRSSELGYEVARARRPAGGTGSRSLSRVGLDDVSARLRRAARLPRPGGRGRSARPAAACGSGRSTCPTAGRIDDPHYTYKLEWLAALRTRSRRRSRPGTPLVVCGDFNVAPTDADVWDPAAFVGSTHVTEPERDALTALRDARPRRRRADADEGSEPVHLLGLSRRHVPQGHGHADRPGLRDEGARRTGRPSAYIDREARKGKGPSDHAPVVVDFTV